MSFCEELLQRYERKFTLSTSHDLTNKLCTGHLPNHKLYTYLVQDLKFFQLGLRLFGNGLRLCDKPQSTVTLGKQIGFFCGDENSYFFKALEQLKVESGHEIESKIPTMLRSQPTLKEVQAYLDTMEYLAYKSNDYAEVVTFLYAMEKVYLGWAQFNIAKGIPEDLPYKYSEWLKLHSGTAFENWVAFLESELNRVAEDLTCRERISKWFEKTVDLEIAFFDACYNYSE